MDKKSLKKRKKREEKKKHMKSKAEQKGFTKEEKRKGLYGIALIVAMAAAAALLGIYQLSS